MNTLRSDWHALKEKWFHGETIDPVFEGVVRDFCQFDEAMQGIQTKVQQFMKGVEQLANGMTALSDGVSAGLSHTADHQISSDSCKLKEATNQIARADAPHSAIAKLRRDMAFNISNPVQNHIANNRNLKVSLDIRRRRLIELTSAKKQFEDCTKKNLSPTDKRYLQAQANFEAAKSTFNDVDRHVFEWLYILEEYRGDILDSTLQTLKYLQYEFFATSAHAISVVLPNRMEFRPMVEMTPDHLEVQVEMELQESEDQEQLEGTGDIADFSVRLIEKKAKEDPEEHAAPNLPVDPLSLSSLMSQGFEEGPARRALRLHGNDTQAALDWLIDGGTEESQAAKKTKALEDGVRMPTTVKRVQKLKAMRKAQAEKNKRRNSRPPPEDSDEEVEETHQRRSSREERIQREDEERVRQSTRPAKAQEPIDLMEVNEVAVTSPPQAAQDLLGFGGDEPPPATDFSKSMDVAPLPQLDMLYDGGSRCEMPPLPASLAAGKVMPRGGSSPKSSGDELLGLSMPQAAPGAVPSGISPEVLAQVQALSAQSQVSPEQLILAAAQQLQSQVSQPAVPAMPGYSATAPLAGQMMQPTQSGGLGGNPLSTTGGLGALDPFQGMSAAAQTSAPQSTGTSGNPTSSNTTEDQFSGLVGMLAPKS